MQLEVANAMTTAQELKQKMEEMNKRLQLYIDVDEYFTFIHWATENSFNKLEGLTVDQMARKIRLFHEDSNEHIVLCSKTINQIEHHQIKSALQRVLASETRRTEKRVKEMERALLIKQVRGGGLFIVILCIIVRFLLLWF
jgi:Fe2+ transport system protein B